MAETRWKVEDAGGIPHRPGIVDISVDGIDVTNSVIGYQIEHDRHGPARLMLVVEPVEVTVVGDAEPVWAGLDGLPSSVLRRALVVAEDREAADG